jgi:hypothetical protein
MISAATAISIVKLSWVIVPPSAAADESDDRSD